MPENQEQRNARLRATPDTLHPDERVIQAAITVMNRNHPNGANLIMKLPCNHVFRRPVPKLAGQKFKIKCSCKTNDEGKPAMVWEVCYRHAGRWDIKPREEES